MILPLALLYLKSEMIMSHSKDNQYLNSFNSLQIKAKFSRVLWKEKMTKMTRNLIKAKKKMGKRRKIKMKIQRRITMVKKDQNQSLTQVQVQIAQDHVKRSQEKMIKTLTKSLRSLQRLSRRLMRLWGRKELHLIWRDKSLRFKILRTFLLIRLIIKWLDL